MLDVKLLNIKLDTLRSYIEYERKEGKKCDIVDMTLKFIQKMIDIELENKKDKTLLKIKDIVDKSRNNKLSITQVENMLERILEEQ